MDIKKLFIAGIAGGVLYFLLGWLVYGNLLAGFMKNHPGIATGVDRTELEFVYLGAGNLLHGFLLAYIFIRANVGSLVSGLITGGIVGFLVAASVDCIIYGTTFVVSKTAMAADVAAFTVMSAIVGAILGLITGPARKEPYK